MPPARGGVMVSVGARGDRRVGETERGRRDQAKERANEKQSEANVYRHRATLVPRPGYGTQTYAITSISPTISSRRVAAPVRRPDIRGRPPCSTGYCGSASGPAQDTEAVCTWVSHVPVRLDAERRQAGDRHGSGCACTSRASSQGIGAIASAVGGTTLTRHLIACGRGGALARPRAVISRRSCGSTGDAKRALYPVDHAVLGMRNRQRPEDHASLRVQ